MKIDGGVMSKIIAFENKEKRVGRLLNEVDEMNKEIIDAADSHVRKMEMKVNSGGSFSDKDIDEMFAHLGELADAGIREEKEKILKNNGML